MRAGRFSFPFAAFPQSRVPSREARWQNRPGAPGSGRSRIGSGFVPSARPRTHGRPSWRSRSRQCGAPGARARASRPDLARDHAVSSRIAAGRLEPRHQLERGARRTGGLPRGGARGRARRRGPCPPPRRASASPGRPRSTRVRRPLGPARLRVSTPVNAHGPPADGPDVSLRRSGAFFSFFGLGDPRDNRWPLSPRAFDVLFFFVQLRRDDGVHEQGGGGFQRVPRRGALRGGAQPTLRGRTRTSLAPAAPPGASSPPSRPRRSPSTVPSPTPSS